LRMCTIGLRFPSPTELNNCSTDGHYAHTLIYRTRGIADIVFDPLPLPTNYLPVSALPIGSPLIPAWLTPIVYDYTPLPAPSPDEPRYKVMLSNEVRRLTFHVTMDDPLLLQPDVNDRIMTYTIQLHPPVQCPFPLSPSPLTRPKSTNPTRPTPPSRHESLPDS
jgi:hypothetical protein